MQLQVVHGDTFVDLFRVVECFVQVVVHERECQLAEDRVEQSMAGHRVGDLQQSVLQMLVLVHQLLANVVSDDLLITLSMKAHFAVQGVGG